MNRMYYFVSAENGYFNGVIEYLPEEDLLSKLESKINQYCDEFGYSEKRIITLSPKREEIDKMVEDKLDEAVEAMEV